MKSLQKGSSPIVVILAVIGAIVLLILGAGFVKGLLTGSPSSSVQNGDADSLQSYETTSFSFYYPGTYVNNEKLMKLAGSKLQIIRAFKDPASDDSIKIKEDGSKSIPTEQSCIDEAHEGNMDVNKNKLIIAKVINEAEFYGCETKTTSTPENISFHKKWLQGHSAATSYAVDTIYEGEKPLLDEAIDKFSLK